jgi:hypothetical protein
MVILTSSPTTRAVLVQSCDDLRFYSFENKMETSRCYRRYVLGLDLGPPGEPTALAVAEQHWPGRDAHIHVRHLHRWVPGTPYPQIVADVVTLTKDRSLHGALLAVDQTGVGRPVAELVEKAVGAYQTTRMVVTAGHAAEWTDDRARLVPKRDLVGVLQVLLQTRRLRVANQLPEAATLERELLTFRAKTPAAGAETVESWRERPHDDLVLAVAFACWLGEWTGPPCTQVPVVIGRRAW